MSRQSSNKLERSVARWLTEWLSRMGPRRRAAVVVTCLILLVAYWWFRPVLERTFHVRLPDWTATPRGSDASVAKEDARGNRQGTTSQSRLPRQAPSGDARILRAFDMRQSGVQVEATAVVHKLLPDDDIGSRHQKMLVKLSSGHMLLIAHNIDLADRVPVQIGDTIEFRGDYEYSEKGGVIHWTHRDPRGTHAAGWIQHRGKRYD